MLTCSCAGCLRLQVKYADHDKVLALTVRVLSGTRTAPPGSGGGQREAVLHVELTDELDPFFLYTLQVTVPPTTKTNCTDYDMRIDRIIYSSSCVMYTIAALKVLKRSAIEL
jgi:hypothetical protein